MELNCAYIKECIPPALAKLKSKAQKLLVDSKQLNYATLQEN